VWRLGHAWVAFWLYGMGGGLKAMWLWGTEDAGCGGG